MVEDFMIYVLRLKIHKKGFFKVGFSLKPDRRIPDIQTNCPLKLSLIALRPGALKDEKAFHKQLVKFKTHGEWFEDTPEVREILKITYVHQDMKKDFSNQSDWYKLCVFMECNKEYSYDSELLFNCLELNARTLEKFYHNKKFDSPFRMEGVSKENAAKVNLVGELNSGRIISHPDLFTPILGPYDKFWQGPIRVTPFNKKDYPDKQLGSYTF